MEIPGCKSGMQLIFPKHDALFFFNFLFKTAQTEINDLGLYQTGNRIPVGFDKCWIGLGF